MARKRRRITLIESERRPPAIRKMMPGVEVEPVEIWIRRPEGRAARFPTRARLCGCHGICLAVVEQ